MAEGVIRNTSTLPGITGRVLVLSFFCIYHKLHRQRSRQSEAADEASLCHLLGHHVVSILDDQQQVLILFGQAFDQTLEGILGFLWKAILAFPLAEYTIQ